MDAARFDRLTKVFAASSRRRIVQALIGGVAGGFLRSSRAAAAACREAGAVCAAGEDCCTGRCDEAAPGGDRHCGCSQGLTACGGVCVDVHVDPANCGKCAHRCRAKSGAATCAHGKCGALPARPCPACGVCQYCDPAADRCVACADSPNPADHCRTADLCAEANRDSAYARIHEELTKRGFAPSEEPEAVVIVDGGTPTGSSAALGTRYVHGAHPGEEAMVYYVPLLTAGAAAIAVVLRDGTADYGLSVDASGRIHVQPAPVAESTTAWHGLRSLPALDEDSVGCSKCYDNCDSLNGPAGNAVVCTLAGAVVCVRAKDPRAVLACGVAAAFVCNRGSAACNDVICEKLLNCPHVCDPTCENLDPSTSLCVSLCTKPNTICLNRTCVCAHVACADNCCPEGEVCKGGACVKDCGPCGYPNNSGQCFDVCAPVNHGDAAGECCIGDNPAHGVCCLPSEHCCKGVCRDRKKFPPCREGPDATCCSDGAVCVDASEGGKVCCLPEQMCGGVCCGGGETCTHPGCCPPSAMSLQGGCMVC